MSRPANKLTSQPVNASRGNLPDLESARIAVIGLGYVGLPLAVALSKHWDVVGFDVGRKRIEDLSSGYDHTREVDTDTLAESGVTFTADPEELRSCQVFIVAVPTPVNQHHYPDLRPLQAATKTVAMQMPLGSVVIYESTVYPGATEEVCIPELELLSGKTVNEDFWVGYSPERINPGDKERGLADIIKITSGSTPPAADWIDALYQKIITAGTHKASTIRVAEAAKAIENTQRDVNIALVNEFAMMFNKMGVDTQAVLEAAGTKWNFLPFKPGLVGGHCIGVDPYYLIHKAQEAGYHPELILASRRINNNMAQHVTNQVLRLMAAKRINVVGANILVLGIAFKENCPDLRNTQVAPIVGQLEDFHANVYVYDPEVDAQECQEELGLTVHSKLPVDKEFDCVIMAVAHDVFTDKWMEIEGVLALDRVVYDVKHVLRGSWVDGRL